MTIKHISSAQNEIFKYFSSLKTKKGREKSNCYLIEGIKLLTEAIDSKANVSKIIIKDSLHDQCGELSNEFDMVELEDRLFNKLSSMVHPEGVMAVIVQDSQNEILIRGQRILFLDGISDPGNLGTILRSAEAFGFHDIFLAPNTVDVYNPKTLRGGMGSHFRLHIQRADYKVFLELKERGYKIASTHLSGKDYTMQDYVENMAIVIGNESHGVTASVSELSDCLIKIPMKGHVESLNASISASIIMSYFDMKIG